MFGCVCWECVGKFAGKIAGEVPNVKMDNADKMEGGGWIGVKREERTIASVHALTSLPQTS
jgi:hypothetical protein